MTTKFPSTQNLNADLINMSWHGRADHFGSYQPNLVYWFFENYLALLEKNCHQFQSAADMNNLDTIPILGVNIDIFGDTLNRFLFRAEY